MRGEEQQDQAPDPETEAEGQACVHTGSDRHCDRSGIVRRISVLCVPAISGRVFVGGERAGDKKRGTNN